MPESSGKVASFEVFDPRCYTTEAKQVIANVRYTVISTTVKNKEAIMVALTIPLTIFSSELYAVSQNILIPEIRTCTQPIKMFHYSKEPIVMKKQFTVEMINKN